MVYKLVGDFDPKEAITHGYVDSQQLFNWQSTDASMADFGGFPSSIIEGTYRENDMTLNTSRRYVIAPSGADHYLVSLSVTTAANQVVATADATDAIVNGFRVTAPTAPPARRARGRRAAPSAAPAAAPVSDAACHRDRDRQLFPFPRCQLPSADRGLVLWPHVDCGRGVPVPGRAGRPARASGR